MSPACNQNQRRKKFYSQKDSSDDPHKQHKKHNNIEKKACSYLFQLSEDHGQIHHNPQKMIESSMKETILYSPWKDKVEEQTFYFTKVRKTKKQNRNPDSKRHLSKLPKFYTQPRQMQQAKTEAMMELQNKIYLSHQVLHITRSIRDTQQRKGQNIGLQKSKMLANCSNLEWKLNIKKKGQINNSAIKMSHLSDVHWNSRTRNLKCAKKKRLKMFGDALSFQKQGCEESKIKYLVHSNPISKTLLQKYLLICDQLPG